MSLLLGIVDQMAAGVRAYSRVMAPRIIKETLHGLVWVMRWTARRRLPHIITLVIHFRAPKIKIRHTVSELKI